MSDLSRVWGDPYLGMSSRVFMLTKNEAYATIFNTAYDGSATIGSFSLKRDILKELEDENLL